MAGMSGGFGAAAAEVGRLASTSMPASTAGIARTRRLLRLSDEVMADLEQANLDGVDRLPDEWRPRLEGLCAQARPGFLGRARRLRTPTAALNLVFDVQELLLALLTAARRPRGRRQ